jgi:hypothetical protein
MLTLLKRQTIRLLAACVLFCGSACKKEEPPGPPDPEALKREAKQLEELREKERSNKRTQ